MLVSTDVRDGMASRLGIFSTANLTKKGRSKPRPLYRRIGSSEFEVERHSICPRVAIDDPGKTKLAEVHRTCDIILVGQIFAPECHAEAIAHTAEFDSFDADLLLGRMADAIGAERVGFRISPGNPYNGMDPADPAPVFSALLQAADKIGNARTGTGLAYVHVIDMGLLELDTLAMVRSNWSGPVIANNNLNVSTARQLIESRKANATSFGRMFIANPKLPSLFRSGASLSKVQYDFLYSGEERGYTDY